MRKLIMPLWAVWIVTYQTYTGRNYVPCKGTQAVIVSTAPSIVYEQPLCVSYEIVPVTWPVRFKTESDARDTAEIVKAQKNTINVTVEKKAK